MNMPEAYAVVLELAVKRGAENISALPCCWETAVDKWFVALNGRSEPTKSSHGSDVPPYSVYIAYNGWPAGIIDPHGGIIAGGEAANEETFIKAIREALAA